MNMYKQLFPKAFLLSCIFGAYAVTCIALPDDTAEKKYAIAFDLDGVLFREAGLGTKIKSFFHVSPRIWKQAAEQLRYYGKGSINTWRRLCLEHGDSAGASYFTTMMASKKIYSDTRSIIRQLHKKGYKLFIASNVSKEEIEFHKQQKETAVLFNLFAGMVEVDDAPGKTAVKKPSPLYFADLKRIMLEQSDPTTTLVFIDNDIRNIEAAQQAGFIAIHCTNPKNLWTQLRELGIHI